MKCVPLRGNVMSSPGENLKMRMPTVAKVKFVHIALITAATCITADACTRGVYTGLNGLVITGRSMDWKDKIPGNLWALPAGITREGMVGPSSIKWTSKYGSLVTTSFNIATVDGMNEKGLAGNMLWLVPAKYPEFTGQQPGVSIALWLQYALDNFATVQEAVNAFAKEEFVIVSSEIPGTTRFTTVHIALSDATGDSAIFEYVDGKLRIHHDKKYAVMTNEPVYEDQLALNAYWQSIGGLTMLPGTNRAADRFVRASFYLSAIPKTDDARVGVASVFSIIRNCSVPYGISTGEANISTTQWRTVVDHKNLTYYYESALSPNVFWVNLTKLDLKRGAPVKKLTVGDIFNYAGESSAKFETSAPFEFAGLTPEQIRKLKRG
jgi:choloylglycine hydrolase